MRSRTMLAAGAVLALGGCGGPESAANAPTVAETVPPSAMIERIDEPATATTPAERLDGDIVAVWIGGSDLELDGRSLPGAVADRGPTIDGRPFDIIADVSIAPRPVDIRERVERAGERNVDALIVPMSPSWLTWDGRDGCDGVTPPHAFYACILEPAPGTDQSALLAEVAALIDAIVATDVPAYVYVIPHSTDALTDPRLADRLAATEAIFASFDPGVDRITYVGHIVSRDLDPLREGVGFFDMVHPTAAGIDALADFFADELPRAIRPN